MPSAAIAPAVFLRRQSHAQHQPAPIAASIQNHAGSGRNRSNTMPVAQQASTTTSGWYAYRSAAVGDSEATERMIWQRVSVDRRDLSKRLRQRLRSSDFKSI